MSHGSPVTNHDTMYTLDFVVQPRLQPSLSLAEDRHFLHAVGRPARARSGILRVYDFEQPLLSLGRYHVLPDAPTSGAVQLHRRYTGGRAIPFGDGFVGVALTLPHRSALLSTDPYALAPYQVMNRYVRGVITTCKLAGIEPFYPGRDFLTVNRRVIGLISFEVDTSGALLFEAIIANHRDFSVLPQWLEQVDPRGVVKAEVLTPEGTTSLSRELATQLTTEEVAELLRRGYEQQFRVRCEPHTASPLEEQAIKAAAHEFDDERWLAQRRVPPHRDHHAWTRVQLGTFEAYYSLEQERFIKDVMFAGDFIANSPAIDRLEHELKLCPADWRNIDAVANDIFSQPENYILGIGPVRTIADTICKALPA